MIKDSKYVTSLKAKHKERADKVSIPYLYSDVDETLIIWPKFPHHKRKGSIKVKFLGATYYLLPHKKNIETLKLSKKYGFKVVIWSKGGDLWAKTIIKALKLNYIPDYILAKPTNVIDDLFDANDYIGTNLWKPHGPI